MSKYWYKFWHHECPSCGRGRTLKERRYDAKPSEYSVRHITVEQYDWCDF